MELHMLTFWIASGYYCQAWHFTCASIDRPFATETSTGLDADAVKSLDKTPPVVVIEEASLFVYKIVLSETVKLSIERTLTKSCAVCPYIESSTKAL